MSHRLTGGRLAMLAGIVVIVAAAVFFGRGLLHRGASATQVTVEAAQRRDIVVTIEATGVVEPVDLVEVKSKASGQILEMPVQVGSVVRAGDLLAQIDKVDVQNQYEQASAAERAAQAKVDVSTAQLKRAEELFAQRITTIVEHEAATLDFANAESQLVKARTDLDTARQRRADATVRAPISGTVLEQLVSAGQVIASATSSVSGGTALLRMADLSRIRLRALVAETDIGSVRPGQVAAVSVEAFPQRSFQGLVEKVEPQAVVQQSVTMFPVLISISNEDGLLLPGMNGEISMTVDRRDNVLAVPLDAVRTARELPTVAASLGLVADSVQAQIARQFGKRGGTRPPGTGAGGDSSHARGPRAGAGQRPGQGSVAGGGTGSRAAAAGTASNGRSGRGQAVLVQTAKGLEPRLVRTGLSDFDYTEILDGLNEGDEVVLLSVLEQQAKRTADQSRIRARMGTGVPGATPAGGGGGAPGAGGGANMIFGEVMGVAVEALRANKLRSMLTMLGIVIGVAAVIAMVALGRGAQQAVNQRITSLGTTLLTVMPGQARGPGTVASSSDRAPLTLDDAVAIEARSVHILAVQPEMSRQLQVQYESKNTNTTIVGTTANYTDVRKFSIASGRMFTTSEDAARRRVAVLGSQVVQDLGVATTSDLLGAEIRIGGIRFQVVGLLTSKGQGGGFNNPDDQVLIPIQTAQYRLIGSGRLRSINVLSPTEAEIPATMAEIQKILRREHRTAAGQADDFNIRNQADFLATLGETTKVFTYLLAGIAAVSLLVGGIGIMNIMLVSVTERTREIGIRKALGATQVNILLQFLIEAMVLCLLGGIIGIGVGAGAATVLRVAFGWSTSVGPSSVLAAFLFAAVVGIVFGVWPARRAASLDPIEALRYE